MRPRVASADIAVAARLASYGADSRFVRGAVGTGLALLGAAVLGPYTLSSSQRAAHGPDLAVAGVVDLALALLVIVAARTPRSLGSIPLTPTALALGAAMAVYSSGGAHGMLNMAVPVVILTATAFLSCRQAVAVTALVYSAHLAGTFTHGPLDGHALYELAEALGIGTAALLGLTALKKGLLRENGALEIKNDLLRARVRELDALHALAHGVGAAMSEEELGRLGLESALGLSGGHSGVLWRTSPDGFLRVAALHGSLVHGQRWDAPLRVSDLGPEAVSAAMRRRVIPVADATEIPPLAGLGFDPQSAGMLEDLSRRSALVIPLRATSTLVGMMVIVEESRRRPPEATLAVLATLATELALALDRRRKSVLVDHQRRQLETLSEIASRVTASLDTDELLTYTVAETAELMDADAAFIATKMDGSEDLQIVSHSGFRTTSMVSLVIKEGQGIGGRVARDGRVHQSVDYCRDGRLEDVYKQAVSEEGLVSLIGAPLVNRGRMVGVIYAARRYRQAFTADQAAVLARLGVQVAVAIENARLYQDVKEKSVRDPLTGAYNRRFFDQRLEEEAARASRGGGPASLLLIDVDDFKRYNDTYGHSRGDILLKEIVALCASTVRASDIVGRYGGEEFVILFPDTPLSAAMAVGERLRKAIRTRLSARLGAGERVSVSGGLAALDAEDPSPSSALERADSAMYEAKAAGKDRIHLGERAVSAERAPARGSL